MIIEAQNLLKKYGKNENEIIAVDNVNLKISSGELVSISGSSGSGKSTLLNLLSGLDKPTSGKVLYNGNDLYSMTDDSLSLFRCTRIGFIFQQFNLLPILTAKENIIMPILLAKRKVNNEYLNKIVRILNIENRLEHMPSELSGGQQQRVAIARALISEPDIIFADEPTGNLDTKNSDAVIGILKEIWQEMEKTVVIITHNPTIANMAETKYLISDGEIYYENI